MPWFELSVRMHREATDEAESVLQEHGAVAITLLDDADEPVLEPGPGETPLWPSVRVCGLFESGVDRRAVTAGLQGLPGADRPDCLRWRTVQDQDWERAWMDRFEPMQFGRRLWIVPSGMAIPSDPGNVEIQLDPGLAFGTGTHPTTALCLEWLDGQGVSGRRVVDYGCGSGVLGIAAALLGAERVLCVDNDPQALEATLGNAQRNRVSDRVDCLSPGDFRGRDADIVLANILAGPLVSLAPVIMGCAAHGALIVLSGLIRGQADEVTRAYRRCCVLRGRAEREGWVRLDLERTDGFPEH